jgi:hypothetical protein
MDNIFQPGVNDLILVLRNLDKPGDKGGFSLSLQVDGCEGVIAPPDTNVVPVDTICDTVGVVVNSKWMMSTTVTGTGVSGNWAGVMGSLPDTSTFTDPVVLGQHQSVQELIKANKSTWRRTLAIELSYGLEGFNVQCDLVLLFTEDSMDMLNAKLAHLMED